MTRWIHITSRTNRQVKQVVALRQQRNRRKTGLFIAEGVREISRALDAGLSMDRLFVCPELSEQSLSSIGPSMSGDHSMAPHAIDTRTPANVQRFETGPEIFQKLTYRQKPEGILAVFQQRVWDIESLVGGTNLAPERGPDPADLWLVAVGATKPGNVGAMARAAAGAGAWGLLLADCVVDPFNPNAIRASTGAVFNLPVATGTTAQVLSMLTKRGAAMVAAVPEADQIYTQIDMTEPVALLIGAEDSGLGPTWLKVAAPPQGHQVSIPLLGRGVDSLNAATAAAVLLYEAVRQRTPLHSPSS